MPQMWEDLVWKSKNVDASLFAVKKKFKEVQLQMDLWTFYLNNLGF